MLIMIVNDASMKEPHEQDGRQVAAILFKNSLYMGTLEGDTTNFKKSVWFQIDETTRIQIKDALLTTLGTQGEVDKRLMKDTSVCISAIAGLEIPMGQWSDFIQTMAEKGMQNESMFFKMAGINNIGLVVEDMDAIHLTEDDQFAIWNVMLNNINTNQLELTKIVAKSISRMATYSQKVFEDSNRRDSIMASLFDLL